jgi:hypothetical protein
VGQGSWYPSAGIQSRTLQVRLPMLVRPYGAQESDCISAAFGDIPAEGYQLPCPSSNSSRPDDRVPSLELAYRMPFVGASPVTPRANVAEGRDMQSDPCPP